MKRDGQKIRVNISMDKDIHKALKYHNFKVSTLIDKLLRKHLSLFPNLYSSKLNPEVVGSNPTFAI
jgi:hypothetical protein